ncbi:MAG: hypothetical protein ACK5U7_09935 [Bacteroidota bacterium]|jgi:hypothetical protein
MPDYRNPPQKIEPPPQLFPTLAELSEPVREKILQELEARATLVLPPPGDLLDHKRLIDYTGAYTKHEFVKFVRRSVTPTKE